ncbi:MAG: TonB-dependent receptor [Methylococcales bacterium]|nr:TonB-dependent receptor [Methylococcales bacterium]
MAEVDYFSMSPAELAATTVTIATGTPKAVFQSAAVTSVVTAEQIKSMGATELHEVLETVPGVHASLQSSTYDYSYSLRGIRNATNSELLMMVNGTRINTPFRGSTMTHFELPLEAVERVEVIRGPGSALYGADAFAGVINIITKKAKDINGTKMGVRAGNANTESAWGQHSAQWAGWDIAASLQYQHTTGDPDRTIVTDFQTTKDKAFGTNASNAPGAYQGRYETLDAHLNLQRKHWDIDFWSFTSMNGGSRLGVGAVLDPNGESNGQQYVGDVHFSTEDWLDDWELTAHLSYLQANFSGDFQLFANNAQLPIAADGNISNSLNPALKRTLFPDGANDDLGRIENIPAIELSSIYKGFDNHLLRFGTGFRYEQISTRHARNYGAGVINGTQPPAVISGALTDVSNTPYSYLAGIGRSIWSGVLQDEWQFADNWQLTAGLRYDNYSDFGSTFNPRAALVWDVNKQVTTKLLYGKAFRAPSFSEQGNQNNPVLLGNKDLKPETINTFEWAIDYRPVSSLRTALNVYYYEIKDLIAAVPDVGKPSATFRNSGNQHGYGSEFEWNWQASEQWSVSGNYAWQRAISQQTHDRVTYVPEHHIYAAVDWQFLPQWQLQPQINWIGGRVRTATDNRQLQDYQTIDLTLRGKKLFNHLNVTASVRNLLDAENNLEPAPTALPQNIPMSGRLFYLEAAVNF